MPQYHVTLNGNAWVRLSVDVEAEDEQDAIEKASRLGQWSITGEIERTGSDVTLHEPIATAK